MINKGTSFLPEYEERTNLQIQVQEQQHVQAINRQNHMHEENMQAKTNAHENEMQASQFAHEKELKDADLGYIGRIFGSADNLSKNITATFLILLLICVVVLTVILWSKSDDSNVIVEILKTLIPLLSLSLGYLFGKK